MTKRKLFLVALFVSAIFCRAATSGEFGEEIRVEALKQEELGNEKNAAELFRSLALSPDNTPRTAVRDLWNAWRLFGKIWNGGSWNDRTRNKEEQQALLDATEAARPGGWRIPMAIVALRMGVKYTPAMRLEQHYYGWEWESQQEFAYERAKALHRLRELEKELADTRDPASPDDITDFYLLFANLIKGGYGREYLLADLTDIEKAPESGAFDLIDARRVPGAPVDADGAPLFYRLPSSWESAANDGERWRWLLERMAEAGGKEWRDRAGLMFAWFLNRTLGVESMERHFPWPRASLNVESGPFAVGTLSDNETIALLVTGLKRLTLPDEFNPVLILDRLHRDAGSPEIRLSVCKTLAGIYEARLQYPKAAAMWQEALSLLPMGEERDRVQASLDRITGNNGELEAVGSLPAGKRPHLSYLFRNGDSITLTAYRLDDRLLLADIRAELESKQIGLDGNQTNADPDDSEKLHSRVVHNPAKIGNLVVEKDAIRYIAEKTLEWNVALEPPPEHRSGRVSLEMPFSMAGCYLVEAVMANGNTSRVVLWLHELAILHCLSAKDEVFQVVDAVTGCPVAGVEMSFFGYAQGEKPTRFGNFSRQTDDDGLVFVGEDDYRKAVPQTIVAHAADGRFCFLNSQIYRRGEDEKKKALPPDVSVFIITDRPVYRPGQEIHFKLWLGRKTMREEDADSYVSGLPLAVRIFDPQGKMIYQKEVVTDSYGGFDDTITFGDVALLGEYRIQAVDSLDNESRWFMDYGSTGVARFRLEEYRKPEFEVIVETPRSAIALGDSVVVETRAKYHYGSPVSNAAVNYKVLRTTMRSIAFPSLKWDWLYRPETWWRAPKYRWYPGWKDWGIERPQPPLSREYWSWRGEENYLWREVVAEGSGVFDADGLFRFTLDTAPTKGILPDRDHRYEISVEVTDQSRRVVAGTGEVTATRRPYNVFVLPDREHYSPGQEMQFRIAAVRRQGGNVEADGTATLYKIFYDSDRNPTEEPVASVDFAIDAKGEARIAFPAGAAGQYRLSCVTRDKNGRRAEGATILTVFGQPGEGDFRFYELDLMPDKVRYRPGETMRLAVVSARPSASALLFIGSNGSDREAKLPKSPLPLRLENHVAIIDVPVTSDDAPGFVIEAVAVVDGVEHRSKVNILVPPADKLLAVDMETDKAVYAPGEKATLTVRVADADGKPIAAECVIAVYDKAIDAIAGNVDAADIRSYFWKDIWHRKGYMPDGSSLRSGYRALRKGDVEWKPIGPFGQAEARWRSDDAKTMMLDYNHPMYSMPTQEQVDAPFKMAQPGLRSNFADTALWTAKLETDDRGEATCSFTMPENLTAWRARVWVMGPGTRVGARETIATTRKNIIIRPQTPRFLTQKDRATVSANLHNYLSTAKTALVELDLGGEAMEAVGNGDLARTVELPPNGEARVDWLVDARRVGEDTLVMRLLTDEESDAVETRLPVIAHGARKVEAFGGMIDGDGEAVITIRVPDERQPDMSRLEMSFSTTVASTMLDALPYLREYPYACTEQTLNRFLPALVTRKYLERLALLPSGASDAAKESGRGASNNEWIAKFGRPDSANEKLSIFDDEKLAEQVQSGVERLTAMRNDDCGWGWFSGTDEQSWPHNTAIVVHGLITARENGADVPEKLVEEGLEWLRVYEMMQVERVRSYDTGKKLFANDFMGDVGHQFRHLVWNESVADGKEYVNDIDAFVHLVLTEGGRSSAEMRELLLRDRKRLSLSSLAMLGLSLHAAGAVDELDIVLQNLSQYVEEDAGNGAVRLRTPSRNWRWYNDPIETQAWYLMLLARTDPKGDKAAGLAHYLVRHRRNGGYWSSTRDTAYAIQALAEYGTASGETVAGSTVAIYLDDDKVMERTLGLENVLVGNRFVIEGAAVESGEHRLKLVRSGDGAVYYGGALSVFSLEDPIAEAGGELKVKRTYYRLVPEKKSDDAGGTAGLVGGYRRQRISSPFDRDVKAETELESGDLIEVELVVESDDDYEYLVFEDMKPAGCEPLETHSGYSRNSLGAYVEYRDQKVVFFVRVLPRGKRTLRYRLRAETPGIFSALPFAGGGMYAPDLFANSEEIKVKIVDE